MNLYRLTVILALACLSAQARANGYCGDLSNAFGPFDYRKAASEYSHQQHLVESAHFTSDVENLVKGSTGSIGGDLDYTLRAFPNHHRALASVAKLALRTKGPTGIGLKYSFDCYFERALRFQPDDDAVHMIYGTYQFKRGHTAVAIEQLQSAVELNPDNASANYNLGLIYAQQKDYDKARQYAEKAYALDYPAQALKNKLIALGKWTEK